MPVPMMFYSQLANDGFNVSHRSLSARPVEDGWYGLLKRGEQPIRLSNSFVNWLVKFVPRSDEI